MTFEKTFVLQKIEEVYKNIDEAKPIFEFSDKEILKDHLKYHTLERLFQIIVDLMLDINHHFIKELNLKISDDLQGTFYILGENNILAEDFAKKIAPIVGLRNRIVHRYEELDIPLFVRIFRKNFSDFEKYLGYINKQLNGKI